MNELETKKLIRLMFRCWPSQPTDAETIAAWHTMCVDYSLDEISRAVQEIVGSVASSFPPTISEVLGVAQRLRRHSAVHRIPPRADSYGMEHYQHDGRLYIRASRAARAAILAQYRRQ